MPGVFGARRVVNACGVYTDLGGSVLSAGVAARVAEANATWASLEELLAVCGARVAQLCGAPAARVVPGASAGIALSVGACVARGDGAVGSRLPLVDSVVWMQRGHEYQYARCASLAGARVEWVQDIAGALAREAPPAAILHPAHLDERAVGLAEVAPMARAAGVPVVVDAAFMSDPVDAPAHWSALGDVACFSAKYFRGPNAGGFVAGRADVVEWIAALDFTGYEDGEWRPFGRAFKLDRASVVATVAALEEWVALDHRARLAGERERAQALAAGCRGLRGAAVSLARFTWDERVVASEPPNAVLVRGRDPVALVSALAAGDPSVRALTVGDALLLCTETLTPPEGDEVVAALRRVWVDLDDR
jgi:L-seryl-tRNA(Ser) seleniumtransferase